MYIKYHSLFVVKCKYSNQLTNSRTTGAPKEAAMGLLSCVNLLKKAPNFQTTVFSVCDHNKIDFSVQEKL